MSSLFSFSTTPYCTRGGSKLVQPKVNTISFGLNSFAYQGSKVWNNLPRDIKDANCSINCKDLIVRWQGPTSQCGFCVHANDPWNVLSQLIDYIYVFRLSSHAIGMEFDQMMIPCKFSSYTCTHVRSPWQSHAVLSFIHIIITHLYIFIPILVVA